MAISYKDAKKIAKISNKKARNRNERCLEIQESKKSDFLKKS